MSETVDQGFTEIGTDLDALSAQEQKNLAFLQELEAARGVGQLSPDQQAELDALRARIQGATADLAAADVDPSAPAEPPADGGTVTSGAADPSDPAVSSDPSTADAGTVVDGSADMGGVGTVMPEPVPSAPDETSVEPA